MKDILCECMMYLSSILFFDILNVRRICLIINYKILIQNIERSGIREQRKN